MNPCQGNTLNLRSIEEPGLSLPMVSIESQDSQKDSLTSSVADLMTVSSMTVLSEISPASEVPNKYIYNVPGGLEQDPEIIRAEMLFYNTPNSERFSDRVYSSLLNIQEQCEIDYQKLCSSAPKQADFLELANFVDTMIPSFAMFMLRDRRRLTGTASTAQSQSGMQLVNHFRSYYLPQAVLGSAAADELLSVGTGAALEKSSSPASGLIAQQVNSKGTVEAASKPTGSVRNTVMVNGRLSKEAGRRFADGHLMPRTRTRALRTEGHHHDHHHDHDHDNHHDEKPMPLPAPIGPDGKKPFPPPPPPAFRGYGSDSDSDSDGEEDEFHGTREKHWHDSNPWEDHSFSGALSFGAAGDLCMYENLDNLSPPCVDAIADLHSLRQEYWTDYTTSSTSSYHHHHHIIVPILALIGIIALVKKCVLRKRRKAVRDLLSALNADPELKKTVESRLGLSVPAPPCCHDRMHGMSCMQRTCLILGVFLFSFVASLFITITSLELTALIVTKMDEGSDTSTSPGAAMAILFSLCTVQVALLSVMVARCKRRWMRQSATPQPTPATRVASSPSAPPPSNSSTGQRGTVRYLPLQTVTNWIQPRVAAVSSALSSMTQRVANRPPPGYAALDGGDEMTEMIAVGSPTPSYNPNANANQRVVLIPVTPHVVQATPVTGVQFV